MLTVDQYIDFRLIRFSFTLPHRLWDLASNEQNFVRFGYFLFCFALSGDWLVSSLVDPRCSSSMVAGWEGEICVVLVWQIDGHARAIVTLFVFLFLSLLFSVLFFPPWQENSGFFVENYFPKAAVDIKKRYLAKIGLLSLSCSLKLLIFYKLIPKLSQRSQRTTTFSAILPLMQKPRK